jgi:uncharacterized membrane protein YbaN (DUF454 family)
VTFQQLIRMGLDFVRALWTIISSRRPVRITIGLILLLFGIVGLFLPFLQGIAMIVAALAILRQDMPMVERIWQRWIIPLRRRSQEWLQIYRERRARRQQPRI